MKQVFETNYYTPDNYTTYRINASTRITDQVNIEIGTTDAIEAHLRYENIKEDLKKTILKYIMNDSISINLVEYQYNYNKPYNEIIERTLKHEIIVREETLEQIKK